MNYLVAIQFAGMFFMVILANREYSRVLNDYQKLNVVELIIGMGMAFLYALIAAMLLTDNLTKLIAGGTQ